MAAPVRFAIIKGLNHGPIHEAAPGPLAQAWCGIRRQYRHRTMRQEFDTTCPKCLAALKAGRPRAHKS